MEINLLAPAQLSNLLNRLDHTNLVVDSHDGDETCLWAHGLLQVLHADQTIRLHGQVCDIKTFVLQMSAAVEDTLVLGLRSDDVILLATLFEEASDALDTHVVALCCSTGEDDLLGVGTDEICDVFPCFFDGFVRLPTIRVCPGVRVTIQASPVGQHCIQYSGVGRGGGLSVEVDGPCALVHDGCLFEDAGGGTHHGITRHSSLRGGGILGLDAGLVEEGALVLADGALDVDGGVLGRRF